MAKRQLIATLGTFTAFFIAWELVSRSLFNNHLFPPPTIIWTAFIDSIRTGEFVHDVMSSLIRAFFGFITGSICGILLGFLTGSIPFLRLTLGQLAHFLRNIPSIAFVPLAIVWFGIGETSKIFLVLWGVIFPVWISTHHGVIQVNKVYVWAMQSFGAKKIQIVNDVIIPGSMPFIVTGLRVSIAMAFITLVAAEMAGAFSGIGYRISSSHLIFRVDKMLSGIITLGIMGAASDTFYTWGIKKLFPWIKIQ